MTDSSSNQMRCTLRPVMTTRTCIVVHNPANPALTCSLVGKYKEAESDLALGSPIRALVITRK